MATYERLLAWRLAHELALEVYRVTDLWPGSERYELTAQTRKAALSVPANIAEGAAKRGPRELRKYLDIALGSLAELSYFLRFARDRGIIDELQWQHLETVQNQVGKVTWGLYRTVLRTIANRQPPLPALPPSHLPAPQHPPKTPT